MTKSGVLLKSLCDDLARDSIFLEQEWRRTWADLQRLPEIYRVYAAALGKTVDELTKEEKQQAIMDDVQE